MAQEDIKACMKANTLLVKVSNILLPFLSFRIDNYFVSVYGAANHELQSLPQVSFRQFNNINTKIMIADLETIITII